MRNNLYKSMNFSFNIRSVTFYMKRTRDPKEKGVIGIWGKTYNSEHNNVFFTG